jgi:hypothetical protein
LFDADGSFRNVVRPALPHFRNATAGPPRQPTGVDWVVNTVALPAGRVAVHVVRRGDGPGTVSDVPYSDLTVFDSTFQIEAAGIRVGEARFPGLLAGSDAAGNLYFAKLSIPDGGTILKVRLP